jgi:anhydro-N-acetylmuramic acid kinase
MALFMGLMSGTSLDGTDGVLADFDDGRPPRVVAHAHSPFEPPLQQRLLALNTPGEDEIHRAALAANAVTRHYAHVIETLLERSGASRSQVVAVGAHGQTVRHRPLEFDGRGYTIQLLDAAGLAESCGIDVICDFRSRDIAAGGQGAPLVPAFHSAMFHIGAGRDLAVLNIGGIANLTLLPASGDVRGFDCGPGNMLMDLWISRRRGLAFDRNGAWAADGQVIPALLETFLDDPYFRKPPPKSTGRDLFSEAWLDERLARHDGYADDADVMATLCEFTARSAAQALTETQPGTSRLLVCGGGAFNSTLMRRLALLCRSVAVHSTTDAGIPPDQVEALAFAWLAREFSEGRPANLPAVTGARGGRRLGALYPA